ncbi:hypothetical protein V492_05865 [Pseudogymnoascus sp. VKM F-4246]|nr:hypothetical protein V492_05865 [Pseudogymnoascus sp. VKM F-4246]
MEACLPTSGVALRSSFGIPGGRAALSGARIRSTVATTPTAVFAPGADGVTVFADNAVRAADGRVAQVPSIIGSNSREGTAFATTWDEDSVDEAEVALTTTGIRCIALAEVANRLGGGLPTYQYYYTGNFSNIAPLPWIGAARTVEQPLITGQHDQYRGESTDFEKDVSLAMQELWLSFARDVTQDPTSTSSDFTWPEFAITGDTVAVFAEDGQAVQLKNSAEVGPVCEF